MNESDRAKRPWNGFAGGAVVLLYLWWHGWAPFNFLNALRSKQPEPDLIEKREATAIVRLIWRCPEGHLLSEIRSARTDPANAQVWSAVNRIEEREAPLGDWLWLKFFNEVEPAAKLCTTCREPAKKRQSIRLTTDSHEVVFVCRCVRGHPVEVNVNTTAQPEQARADQILRHMRNLKAIRAGLIRRVSGTSHEKCATCGASGERVISVVGISRLLRERKRTELPQRT